MKEHNPSWPQIPDHAEKNIDNWTLWIRKNKFIIQSNKSASRY